MHRTSSARSRQELIDANRAFYDSLWSTARLVQPDRFNTWPLVRELISSSRARIEIAPGLRPRLPLNGTHFVDISRPALTKLRLRGGHVVLGSITALPYGEGAFDLICALDIVEHLQDEDRAFAELARIAAPGAALLFSTPLHPENWRPFDDFVGHCRRYEPGELVRKLADHGFVIEQSAAYGMQVKSSRLLDWGIWWMTNFPRRSMWVYNRFMMPMGVKLEKKLELQAGMIATDGVDEVLILCRKAR